MLLFFGPCGKTGTILFLMEFLGYLSTRLAPASSLGDTGGGPSPPSTTGAQSSSSPLAVAGGRRWAKPVRPTAAARTRFSVHHRRRLLRCSGGLGRLHGTLRAAVAVRCDRRRGAARCQEGAQSGSAIGGVSCATVYDLVGAFSPDQVVV